VAVTENPSREEEVAVVRCPTCRGLRSISFRNRESGALCKDCRRGEVVTVEDFYGFWLTRFSLAEIRVMGRRFGGELASPGPPSPVMQAERTPSATTESRTAGPGLASFSSPPPGKDWARPGRL